MTLADTGGDRAPLLVVARALQVLLVGLAGYGVVVGRFALTVNVVLSLLLTLVPAGLAWRYDHRTDPRLVLWIAVAATLHSIGFLGPYSVQSGPLAYYDQLAHAVSASLVAGVAYALIEALDRTSSRIHFPDDFRVVFTLFFILAFGVGWEIVEFAAGNLASTVGRSEVLVQYGVDDIVADLLFNTLAALLVVLWGTGYFGGLRSFFSRRLLGSRGQ